MKKQHSFGKDIVTEQDRQADSASEGKAVSGAQKKSQKTRERRALKLARERKLAEKRVKEKEREKRLLLRKLAQKKKAAEKKAKAKAKGKSKRSLTGAVSLSKKELDKSKEDEKREALRRRRELKVAENLSRPKEEAIKVVPEKSIETIIKKSLERTPAEAFAWGQSISTMMIKKAGRPAAVKFTSKLRGRWRASQAIVDKKAYDGAKKALSKNILSDHKANRISPGVYSDVAFSVEEACITLDYINHINKSVLLIELGLSDRAIESIDAARPLGSIEQLAALPFVGGSTLSVLRAEANYWMTKKPGKRDSKKREAKERTPSESYSWGRLMAEQILTEEGASAAKNFVKKLRKKWSVSGSIVDKKAYDGAKKTIYIPKKTRSDYIIKHAGVSSSLFETFGVSFMKKYRLKNLYATRRRGLGVPAVYFGCYKQEDVDRIRNNQSDFKIVVYGGTDATRKRILRQLRDIPNLYHVAISKYIADDLKAMKIDYKEVAITPVDHSLLGIRPEPLGRSVYIYNCSKAKAKQYGSELYEEVIRRVGVLNGDIKFEICGHKTHSREELMEVYKRSFMGLRLIEHDGLPNTVIELGLMGRRTVHNGGLPSGIPYSNVEDVCNSVLREFERVGETDHEVARSTLEHLENSRAWLRKSYWEKT